MWRSIHWQQERRDQRRVTTGAQLPWTDPQPPPTPVHDEDGTAEACVSEGRVPGNKSKADLEVRTCWFSAFISHGTTEFGTGLPKAKAGAGPTFAESEVIKLESLFKKKKTANIANWF